MVGYGMLWYGKQEYDRVLYGSCVGKGDTQCVWYGMERYCRASYVGKDCLVPGWGASCVVSILRSRHVTA